MATLILVILYDTVLVTLLRQMISATAYPIREIAAPLALQARGWVHGIRTAFSNVDRKGIEGMERYGYMGA